MRIPRLNYFKRLFAFTVIGTCVAYSAFSQDVRIPEIPAAWPEPVKKSLSSIREPLIQKLKAYNKKLDDFNGYCGEGKIPMDDKARWDACSKLSAALDTEGDLLIAEKKIFLVRFNEQDSIYKESQYQETFFEYMQKDSERYKKQVDKIMAEVDSINVPLPEMKKKIHEGVILGLFNTNEENAIVDPKTRVGSPFTGKKYNDGEFFATSDESSAIELWRGVVDNSYLGEYTLATEHGKKLIEQLQGTEFNRLIAHSNGATVSEALIRKGVITVNELNIVGGDRSLINHFALNELITSGKVKRVVVWINPGDIIPYGTAAGLFAPTMAGHYLKTAKDFVTAKLTGESKGGDAKVEYRYLVGSQYKGQLPPKLGKGMFDAHGLDAYEYNMKEYLKTDK